MSGVGQCVNIRFCEGFRMPAIHGFLISLTAGVRKAPWKETAGRLASMFQVCRPMENALWRWRMLSGTTGARSLRGLICCGVVGPRRWEWRPDVGLDRRPSGGKLWSRRAALWLGVEQAVSRPECD